MVEAEGDRNKCEVLEVMSGSSDTAAREDGGEKGEGEKKGHRDSDYSSSPLAVPSRGSSSSSSSSSVSPSPPSSSPLSSSSFPSRSSIFSPRPSSLPPSPSPLPVSWLSPLSSVPASILSSSLSSSLSRSPFSLPSSVAPSAPPSVTVPLGLSVTLPMTSATISALVLLLFLSAFGTVALWQKLARPRCRCPLCVGELQLEAELSKGGFSRIFLVRTPTSSSTASSSSSSSSHSSSSSSSTATSSPSASTRTSRVPQLVLKRIPAADVVQLNKAQAEAKELRQLGHHPNIVRSLGDFLHSESTALRLRESVFVCIVMERCDRDLAAEMKRQFSSGLHFSEERVLQLFLPLCRALRYCHSRGLVHRDLKPQNVFLTREGEVRLGDFGLSRLKASLRQNSSSSSSSSSNTFSFSLSSSSSSSCSSSITPPTTTACPSSSTTTSLARAGFPASFLDFSSGFSSASSHGRNHSSGVEVGTRPYHAPEMIAHEVSDWVKVDVWGLGLILYELLSLCFLHLREQSLGAALLQDEREIDRVMEDIPPDSYAPEILLLLRRLLCVKPKLRPTVEDIFRIKFFKNKLRQMEKEKAAAAGGGTRAGRRRKKM